MTSAIEAYLSQTQPGEIDAGFLAYIASLEQTRSVAPEVAQSIVSELEDQRRNIKLIASENYSSLATQATMGNLLTDKYAEGFPGRRFYAGCQNVDAVETDADELACRLFGAKHAYTQPHSGADANMIAFWAILSARVEIPELARLESKSALDLSREGWEALRIQLGRQRILGMDLDAGGHLTHGYRLNVSAKMFDAFGYGLDEKTERIDYDAIEKQAREVKPLILLAGYSAYPRKVDFARMREIADAVDAVLLVDMAHFAGLVAGRAFEGNFDPVPHAHIITSTTHKTLRGPRGGIVLSATEELADQVNRGCPLVIGGPLPHVIAAKAVAFTEALQPEFRDYARRVIENAQEFAEAVGRGGLRLVTGGTDNHLVLADVTSHFGLTGRQAETALRECGITLNRNAIPGDPNGPWYTSGLRFGTAAVTTLGMGPDEMREIASIITRVLQGTKPARMKSGKMSKAKYTIEKDSRDEATARIGDLLGRFPLYPSIDLDFLKTHFA